VVVDVGLTLVEPPAELDVKLPGVMAIVVAPLADHLTVLLAPELMLVGLAVNEAIEGFEVLFPDDAVDAPLQPANPMQTDRTNISAQRVAIEIGKPSFHLLRFNLFLRGEFATSIACPFEPAHAGCLRVHSGYFRRHRTCSSLWP
jgi:hypothetical protein